MRNKIQMPVRSKFRPVQTKVQTTYERYISVQTQLGLTIGEARQKWKALERLAEQSAIQGTILKPLNF